MLKSRHHSNGLSLAAAAAISSRTASGALLGPRMDLVVELEWGQPDAWFGFGGGRIESSALPSLVAPIEVTVPRHLGGQRDVIVVDRSQQLVRAPELQACAECVGDGEEVRDGPRPVAEAGE
eukprot:scaffold71920_cov45-Phaeocystis_antarctica.AAC.3